MEERLGEAEQSPVASVNGGGACFCVVHDMVMISRQQVYNIWLLTWRLAMKKNLLILTVSVILSVLPLHSAFAESDLRATAVAKLQNAVLKALPAKPNISRIAVLDFDKDDGSVRNALTAAITEKTDLKVIERTDLDKILKEQGLQLKDILDEKSRITHGKIKGVQGLLFGQVTQSEAGFMSYNLKVSVKFDDVEKGEIVLAKDFSVSAISPYRSWLFYGVAGIIGIIAIIVILSGRRTTAIERTVREDVQVRVDLTREVGRAVAAISEAKAKVMERGDTGSAVFLKDLERDLLLLKEHADHAAQGSADMRALKELKQALDSDMGCRPIFEGVTRSADRVYEMAVACNASGLERELGELKRDIRNAMNEFTRRGI